MAAAESLAPSSTAFSTVRTKVPTIGTARSRLARESPGDSRLASSVMGAPLGFVEAYFRLSHSAERLHLGGPAERKP